jgi:DNA-binding NtrC family response regulator
MQNRLKVLLVDDEKVILDSVADYFDGQYEVSLFQDPRSALAELQARRYDVVVVDERMPGLRGLELLKTARRLEAYCYGVLLTAYADRELLEQFIESGLVRKVLEKPLDLVALAEVLGEASTMCRAHNREAIERAAAGTHYADLLERQGESALGIVGLRGGLRAVFETVERYASVDGNVLITGETGTGKEVVARAIHALSKRSRMPFVKINCGAIPESLIESELFGYVKGAFTGAGRDKRGRIEMADGGTLFLDEVTELRIDLQTRLLHVVQDRSLERLGSTHRVKVDFRLIAASNRELREAVSSGILREDLYYRLAVLPLHLPALRDRPGDVREYAERYLEEYGGAGGPVSVTPEALALLEAYPWPGNVRELEGVMSRALLLGQGQAELGPEAFSFLAAPPGKDRDAAEDEEAAVELLSRLVEAGRIDPDSLESRILGRILHRHGDNAFAAARASGLPKDRFYRVRKRLSLRGEAGPRP